MSDIMVRIEGSKAVVTVVKSEPFFEDAENNYLAAFREYTGLFAALMPPILDLAKLGGIQSKEGLDNGRERRERSERRCS